MVKQLIKKDMKTIKKQIIAIALLLGTLGSYSNNEIDVNKIDSKKVTVEFKNVKKGHQLSIKDNQGVQMYAEIISENGHLTKILDVTSLEEGTYYVELDKDFEIVIKPFQVKKHQVIFDETKEQTIFKPVFRNEKNLLLISKISFDDKANQVVIYYENEIIFSETIKDEPIINRVYRLDNEKKGTYKVVFQSNNRDFINVFKI